MQKLCSLCDQPVRLNDFILISPENKQKQFCCIACLSIYKMLNPEQNSNHSPEKRI